MMLGESITRKKRILALFLALLLGVASGLWPFDAVFAASEACIPGVPCVTPATQNDPAKNNDGPAQGPNAAKSDSAACDADFMNQIYARSFLEANRETTMNQTVLRKPDSVLEYSCFGEVTEAGASKAGAIFSDSALPGAGPSVGAQVGGLVSQALQNYIGTSFGHSFLGGKKNAQPDYKAGAPCDYMNTVHAYAKCGNFGVDDPFLTFQTLITLDPRQFPEACPAGAQRPFTQNMIDVAQNKDFKYVNFDQVKTYLDLVQPPSGCPGPAIPTGVMVSNATQTVDAVGNPSVTKDMYQDKICANPACHYAGQNGGCVR